MFHHVSTRVCLHGILYMSMCVCESEIEGTRKRRAEHGREGVQGGVLAGKNSMEGCTKEGDEACIKTIAHKAVTGSDG